MFVGSSFGDLVRGGSLNRRRKRSPCVRLMVAKQCSNIHDNVRMRPNIDSIGMRVV